MTQNLYDPNFADLIFFFGPTIFSDPKIFRPKFFSDPSFFQTQHFFRSKFFGPQIFSDPHWELLTLSFVWRIKWKLKCCSTQFSLFCWLLQHYPEEIFICHRKSLREYLSFFIKIVIFPYIFKSHRKCFIVIRTVLLQPAGNDK